MRTATYQRLVAKKVLEDNLAKLQTSMNNLKQKKGHTDYQRHLHVQNDALAVVMNIQEVLILQMMVDSEEIPFDAATKVRTDNIA